jgi:predicted NAD/FAD-binding protein
MELTRRQILTTLAAGSAAASLPAGAAPRRVAVIGAGMAGIATAWLLDGTHEVTLFEARADIGGNVRTLQIPAEGRSWAVDMGAQYFHPVPYPTYVQLLEQLGLYPQASGGSHAFPVSITVDQAGEATPRFVSPVLPGRLWPLLAPWNTEAIQAFSTAFSAAKRREQLNAPWSLTLGEWLPTLGLSSTMWEGLLLPWAASLFSGDVEQARGLSARSAMIFAAGAVPDKLTDPVVYHVLDAGMVEPLNRMVAMFTTTQLRLGNPVVSVTRTAQGSIIVQGSQGLAVEVDDVVFAASGPPTLALLAGLPGTALQRAALQGIEFHDARLMLHSDPACAWPAPVMHSFFNSQVGGGYCEGSMRLADVLPPQGGTTPSLWKSWVTHRSSLPQQVLHDVSYRHMLPTPGSLNAQNLLRPLQGRGRLWFAGGYLQKYDSQETALRSAMDVAAALGASSARWQRLSGRA